MRAYGLFTALVVTASVACSSSDKPGGATDLDSGTGGDAHEGDSNAPFDAPPGDSSGFDVAPGDTPTSGTPVVYANTDTQLWSLDPTTKAVTLIGDFSGTTDPVTDVAVDGSNNVFVNTETAVYAAALPSSGTGTVALTLHTSLPSSAKFFALGFVPKGVLGTGEALVAGDGAGHLFFIDTSGASATPQDLGSFGTWATGDPNPSGKAIAGDQWTLSGDVVFYVDAAGTPRGLATVRTCYTTGGSTTCLADDDVLVEVDMTVLASNFTSKTSTTSLRKAFIGTGAGAGRLYGVGAWEDKVYAFSRNNSGSSGGTPVPPELVAIDSTGTGSVLQKFTDSSGKPLFTNGWSGAGVTTKAKISVIK